MPEVTVCVPAYRSGAMLVRTLKSIVTQTFDDLVIDVALEPVDADETISAIRPMLDDPRVRLTVNSEALGFAGNVRSLFGRVQTPTFLFCAHDDILHPQHVEVLIEALRTRPDASVAYGDAYEVGARNGRRGLALPDAGLNDRLLAYFLPGRLASCWRGLTRREVLHRPFPDNAFNGFSTEYEWALHLVVEGVALHVRRPLVVKHLRPAANGSVSAAWKWGSDQSWLKQALEHHRTAMLDAIPRARLSRSDVVEVELAAEVALLARCMDYSSGRFRLDAEQVERLERIMASASSLARPLGQRLTANARTVLAGHLLVVGDLAGAEAAIRTSIEEDPSNPVGPVLLGWIHHASGRLFEALETALGVDAAQPFSGGAREIAEHLEQRFATIA